MALDEQVVEMIRDRFDQLDNSTRDRFDQLTNTCRDIKDSFDTHSGKDEVYWRKIDEQQAQLRLIKGVGGSGAFVAAISWLWSKFGH